MIYVDNNQQWTWRNSGSQVHHHHQNKPDNNNNKSNLTQSCYSNIYFIISLTCFLRLIQLGVEKILMKLHIITLSYHPESVLSSYICTLILQMTMLSPQSHLIITCPCGWVVDVMSCYCHLTFTLTIFRIKSATNTTENDILYFQTWNVLLFLQMNVWIMINKQTWHQSDQSNFDAQCVMSWFVNVTCLFSFKTE